VRHLRTGGLAATLLAGALATIGLTAASGTPLSCTSPGRRVDLAKPSFAAPTTITNPLFPRGPAGQTIQLGAEAGEKLRFEVTQLPDTRVFSWDGHDIATRVTSFVAYKSGHILETAVDYFAQDDAGNVWYFGEDVANYENGVPVNNNGTWFAGRDGPPGMIMPAKPRAGDAFRPENIPGLVFEEVTVMAAGRTVDGPRATVRGAISTLECPMGGGQEEKQFAPGYGELRAQVKSDDEAYYVALAVPLDGLREPMPDELAQLGAGAAAVFDDVPSGGRERVAGTVAAMDRAWDRFEKRSPKLLGRQMNVALDALKSAVGRHQGARARTAAIEVGHAALDLELRYRPQADVDRDRVGLWEAQLRLDREAGDTGAVAGDQVTIRTIRDRIR